MKRDKFLKILGMLILAPIMGNKVSSGLEKKKEPEKSYIADGILTHIPHQNILQNTNSELTYRNGNGRSYDKTKFS